MNILEYKFEMKSTHSFLLKKEENIINLINNRQNIIIYLLSKNGLKENIQAKAIIPISDFFKLSSKKKNINTEIIKFDNDYPLNSNDLNVFINFLLIIFLFQFRKMKFLKLQI